MSTHSTLHTPEGTPNDHPISHRRWKLRVFRLWQRELAGFSRLERWQAEAYRSPKVPPPEGLADWELFTQASTPEAALAAVRVECDRFDEAFPELGQVGGGGDR